MGSAGADGADGATGPAGTDGEDGAMGLAGANGTNGTDGASGTPCWDLNGDGVNNASEDVNDDGSFNTFDCKGDQVINLTVEIPEVPGIVADDFVTLFPDFVQNIAEIEIEGLCSGPVVVVNGPGFEIEIVPGFDSLGNPDDNTGLSAELPIVIEAFETPPGGSTGGCSPSEIGTWVATPEILRGIALHTTTAAGARVVTWTLNNFAPDGSGVPGFDGRTRFTFVHRGPPDNLMDINRSPAVFGSANANNPATDKNIEISNLSIISPDFPGRYPAVLDEDASLLRLTLLYDFVEGGNIFLWAAIIAEFSTTAIGKSQILVITPGAGGGSPTEELYNGCFPIRWEQRGGFGQDIKLQDFVVIDCDTRAPVGP
jgi:hypothetical protein